MPYIATRGCCGGGGVPLPQSGGGIGGQSEVAASVIGQAGGLAMTTIYSRGKTGKIHYFSNFQFNSKDILSGPVWQ